ncbi:MAG TPA: hypothetical protein PLG60_07515 [Acidimicrobiales bacterium]|nr:hypothetical protein [Acidimicrobiales bacterium]
MLAEALEYFEDSLDLSVHPRHRTIRSNYFVTLAVLALIIAVFSLRQGSLGVAWTAFAPLGVVVAMTYLPRVVVLGYAFSDRIFEPELLYRSAIVTKPHLLSELRGERRVATVASSRVTRPRWRSAPRVASRRARRVESVAQTLTRNFEPSCDLERASVASPRPGELNGLMRQVFAKYRRHVVATPRRGHDCDVASLREAPPRAAP